MNTKFAVVFPGQGSQSVGMLAELAVEEPIIQATFAEASQALGYDLWQLVQEGPVDELNKTWRTQPALLTASVALWRVWQSRHYAEPAFMAGHSLGEYSAYVCAGVLEFSDAVKLVELRGQLMQDAVPAGHGAMYAVIGLDDDAVVKACSGAAQGDVVAPVNFNSPGQVVIAGSKEAVERAVIACKEAGAKRVLPLAVSVPSHCDLMKSAASELAVALERLTLNLPHCPVINNVDVTIASSVEEIRDALVRQLYRPVRWSEVVGKMAAENVTQLFEMGPGKVLTGLTKRINGNLQATAINEPAGFAAVLEMQ